MSRSITKSAQSQYTAWNEHLQVRQADQPRSSNLLWPVVRQSHTAHTQQTGGPQVNKNPEHKHHELYTVVTSQDSTGNYTDTRIHLHPRDIQL